LLRKGNAERGCACTFSHSSAEGGSIIFICGVIEFKKDTFTAYVELSFISFFGCTSLIVRPISDAVPGISTEDLDAR
jgi:hypothetical protein